MKYVTMVIGLLTLVAVAIPAAAEVRLTVDEATERALNFNRTYLSAQEEIAKADGDIAAARAGALPTITLNSSYSRDFKIASAFFTVDGETSELQMGFRNNFSAGVSLRQPLWEGGKVFTAYAVARQYKKYSIAGTDQVSAAVVYNSELLFYSVILEKARLAVLQDALKTYDQNIDVVEKFYSQGLVSRFELLRARVERANVLPQILEAESNVRLAEKRLLSFLGMNLDEQLAVVEPNDDTSLAMLPDLRFLIAKALEERPELRQAELEVDMRGKAVGIARAGYFPSLAAVSSYAWQASADEFSLDRNNTTSFTAGLTLSFPIFDGGQTRGEVGRSKADLRQAELRRLDLIDDVTLGVEQAYDRLIQAKKALDIQGDTIAQAEEGLHIAGVRYEAGEGTLLELLSAQTALSESRTALAGATFAFRSARANLKQATTVDINTKLR